MSRTISWDASGRVPCTIFEATKVVGAGSACNVPGRTLLCAPDLVARIGTTQWNSFCEIPQLTGAGLGACQNDVTEPAADGWCYIQVESTGPTIGNASLVSTCPDAQKQRIRFVGAGAPASGGQLYIHCAGG